MTFFTGLFSATRADKYGCMMFCTPSGQGLMFACEAHSCTAKICPGATVGYSDTIVVGTMGAFIKYLSVAEWRLHQHYVSPKPTEAEWCFDGGPSVAVTLPLPEKPCGHCGAKNDIGVKKCWSCEQKP